MRPISILLLFSLVTANCANLLVFLGFEMNQKYIIRELCVNKNKPQLQCNGKCYLMNKLKQAQDKEQKQERQTQTTQVQDALITVPLNFKQFALAEIKHLFPYSTGMPRSIKNSIFHPPQLV